MLWWGLLRRSNNEGFFSHFISSILCLYFHYSFGLISFNSGFATQMRFVNKLFVAFNILIFLIFILIGNLQIKVANPFKMMVAVLSQELQATKCDVT
jgi:hypothetical protein